jgi:8-oxo-dGTP diphosphatase
MAYDPRSFPPFAVTVDIVLFTVSDTLEILLVERGGPPFEGAMALPGGFVAPDESVTDAAWRELAEETGLDGDLLKGVHLEQLATFGAVDRDPRMRVVSVAYVGMCSVRPELLAGTDARDAVWVDVTQLRELAFDHAEIIATGLERVRAKLEYTTLATSLAGEDFTLGDLHRIYEVVWGIELDLANFRRKVLATDGFVEPTWQKRVSPAGGAPAAVYRAGTATHLSPPLVRPQ